MSQEPFRVEPYIEGAKKTPGRHLYIGRAGDSLHSASSCLSGYDCEAVKSACIGARLPVIDTRNISFDQAASLSVRGPMIAVDKAPDPPPWNAFSYAPLGVVAAAYRKAGAEIFNIAEADLDETAFPDLLNGPLKSIIEGWHDYVLNSEF
jgi:hypothetical protein